MADSIQVFNSEDFGSIRAIKIEDEPWFVAKDVCDVLGIDTNHIREGLDWCINHYCKAHIVA